MGPYPLRLAGPLAALLFLDACAGRGALAPTSKTSDQQGPHFEILIASLLEFAFTPASIDVEASGPDSTTTKAHFQLVPQANGFDRFSLPDWYRGPGNYRLRLSYTHLLVPRAFEAVFTVSGKEEAVEATLSFERSETPASLHVELLLPAPPELTADFAWSPAAEGVGRYRLHNRSTSPVVATTAPMLERRTPLGWSPVPSHERGSVCLMARTEGRIPPGSSLHAEEWVDYCGLRPLDPGDYRHTMRLWMEGSEVRTCSESGHPVEVRQVWLLRQTFELRKAASSTLVRMKHAFPDAPMDSLRLSGYLLVSGTFSALVQDESHRASCVCEGALIGKEGWRATALAGRCLYVAGPDVDERACIPERPDLRGDPVLVPSEQPLQVR